MVKKILLYTFYNWNAVSYKLLRSLTEPEVYKMFIRGVEGAKRLTKNIIQENYSHVLGLGDFRKDAKKIRTETVFINKYGKNYIRKDAPMFYKSTWKLPLYENCIRGIKPSNGPCNQSAYMILDSLNVNNLQTKVAFVHIPRMFDMDSVKNILNNWCQEVM
jgi:hypothetical protein